VPVGEAVLRHRVLINYSLFRHSLLRPGCSFCASKKNLKMGEGDDDRPDMVNRDPNGLNDNLTVSVPQKLLIKQK